VSYQGRKKAKTSNHLILCDNQYHILAISDTISGNHHDNFELVDNFSKMLKSLEQAEIDYSHSHLNADTAFDVKDFMEYLEKEKDMIANIPKNKRNTKKVTQAYRYLSEYIYSFRFKIEVVFAWLDTYKRLLVRFEYCAKNFRAWLLLAASLINLRNIFN
jgi:DDE superfamily endonuclease